ncbi:DUF1302 family protein [Pontibacterium sinense]|uniref:DUF1302 family protein n=1 Tax=Pontibacterium sinense TaxID=2781979 RepID=UPI001D133927|nr:DUF1302 family protein [Pontibacterium sinense]
MSRMLVLKHLLPSLFAITTLCQPLLAAEEWGDDSWGEEEESTPWHGFVELSAGARLDSDPVLPDEDLTLADMRAQLEIADYIGGNRYSLKADLYADGVEHGLHGELREALLDISPGQNLDLRIGQQILTWGTGDLLFINDMFPKDWVSYFSGRDDQYLKAPSASAKLSYYNEAANIDLVWTPLFTSDRFIDGERFSYFDAMSGQQTAQHLVPLDPEETPDNGELALRLHGTQAGTEWALYAYRGFWKQPNAMTAAGDAYFSRLNTYGASVRGNLGAGIANAELGWYEGEDHRGDDPRLPNDQLRLLVGYEQELVANLTAATQYYLEWIQDYSALTRTDGNSRFRPDEKRHVWTLRLTYRMMQDNLILSWFNYWSPSDEDMFLRPSVTYRFDDSTSLVTGANIFVGEKEHTFFGQFEDASSVYARLRYSF